MPLVSNKTHVGLSTPAIHGLKVSGVTFVEYSGPHTWAVGACSRCETFGPSEGGFDTFFEGIAWVNSSNRRLWRWSHEAVHLDVDGACYGVALDQEQANLSCIASSGTFAGRKTSVASSGLVNVLSSCGPDPFSGGAVGGVLCSGLTFRRVALNSTQPNPLAQGLLVSLLEFPANTSLAPWNSKRLTHPYGFAFLAAVNHVRCWHH